jgi:hypothetical protein
LTRRGESFNFCLLKNIDFIQQDPLSRIQPCIAMGAAHGSGLGNIIPDPQRRVEQVMYFCHADLKEKGPLILVIHHGGFTLQCGLIHHGGHNLCACLPQAGFLFFARHNCFNEMIF